MSVAIDEVIGHCEQDGIKFVVIQLRLLVVTGKSVIFQDARFRLELARTTDDPKSIFDQNNAVAHSSVIKST